MCGICHEPICTYHSNAKNQRVAHMYHIFLFITYGRYEVTYFVIIQFANNQENCQIIVSPEIDRLVMLMRTNLKNAGLMKSLLDATQFGSKSKKLSKGLAFRKGHHQFWWKKMEFSFLEKGTDSDFLRVTE